MGDENGRRFFEVTNLEKYQNSKYRRPPWIKWHRKCLANPDFCALPDAAKAHLVLICMIATAHQNRMPLDPVWIAHEIHATDPVDLDLLIQSEFIRPLHNNSSSYPTLPLKSYRALNGRSVVNMQAPENQKRRKSKGEPEFEDDFDLIDKEELKSNLN